MTENIILTCGAFTVNTRIMLLNQLGHDIENTVLLIITMVCVFISIIIINIDNV